MNQAQIHAVIEELYGEPELPKPTNKDQKRQSPKKPAPATNKDPAAGDYADYYKRIREMAKDKGTKEEDVLFLLRERQKGEQAYRNWKQAKLRKAPPARYEHEAPARLYALAEQRRMKQERTAAEKEAFEAEEIDNLAHIHADKHIIQDNVRSIEQFMQD